MSVSDLERSGLLDDVRRNPHDDLPRCVYADWLEDHASCDADVERARFIRVQVALAPYSWGLARKFPVRDRDRLFTLVDEETELLGRPWARRPIVVDEAIESRDTVPGELGYGFVWYRGFVQHLQMYAGDWCRPLMGVCDVLHVQLTRDESQADLASLVLLCGARGIGSVETDCHVTIDDLHEVLRQLGSRRFGRQDHHLELCLHCIQERRAPPGGWYLFDDPRRPALACQSSPSADVRESTSRVLDDLERLGVRTTFFDRAASKKSLSLPAFRYSGRRVTRGRLHAWDRSCPVSVEWMDHPA